MPKITIPEKGIWKGQYAGEKFGHFISSFNLDLERNVGNINLADRLRTVFSSTDDADLGLPTSFIKSNADTVNRYWALTGAVLFKSDAGDPEAGWAQDAIASTPTTGRDNLLEYSDFLLCPTSTNIAQLSAGTWTASWWSGLSGASALQSGVKHIIEITPVGHLAVADGRYLNTYDGSTASDPKLTLPSEFEITDLRRAGDFLIIATKTIDNTEAKVFHWDGTSGTYNSFYGSESIEIVAIFVADEVPYIITKTGQIRKFTGSGYEEVQEFPSHKINQSVTIYHDGIKELNGKAAIAVAMGATIAMAPELADGIWMFDPKDKTLYHRYSLSAQPHGSGGTNDHGHRYANAIGGLLETADASGALLAGATLFTDYSGTTLKVICTSMEANTDNARGTFITPKLYSRDATLFAKRLQVIFKQLVNSTDRIIIKYRNVEDVSLPMVKTTTFASGTTFTVAAAGGLAVGEEVEITAGKNAGVIAHITDITGTTITVDETYAQTSGIGLGLFTNFKKLITISSQTIESKIASILKKSAWIQFKIELRGARTGTTTSPEIAKLLFDYQSLQR